MSLVIAHMQKNRKYSSITCHKFNSLYTHGINWEWLWVRNYEHTHRPTHRVASGINSVMGLKNKTKKTGRRNTENTNTIFCPFKSSSSHRNATLRSSSNVFLCFAKPAESRNNGEAFSSYKNKTEKKLPRSHGGRRPPVDGGGRRSLLVKLGRFGSRAAVASLFSFTQKHIKNINWSNRTSGWWIFNLGNPKRCESVLFGLVRRDVQLLI